MSHYCKFSTLFLRTDNFIFLTSIMRTFKTFLQQCFDSNFFNYSFKKYLITDAGICSYLDSSHKKVEKHVVARCKEGVDHVLKLHAAASYLPY